MTLISEVSTVYPWQKDVWSMLTTRFPNIGHGILLYGRSGCGKRAFTEHLVAWLLCLNKSPHGACGQCSSCMWLKSDTHPNVVHITTDEDNKKQNAKIKIEKIRDLQPFIQQTGDGWRVVVIEPAEALNIASANALLKTLEEPGERVLLILIATHYLKLHATIRSRLQHFAMDRIQAEQAHDYMVEQIQDENAHTKISLLLNLSNGMPLKALSMLNETWLGKRGEFLNDWKKIVQDKSMPLYYSSKWQKELSFSDWMMLFEYLLADLICVKLNQPLKNIDLQFDELAMVYSTESLFNLYSQVQEAKKLIEQNVQTQLVMDQIFIKLMNI